MDDMTFLTLYSLLIHQLSIIMARLINLDDDENDIVSLPGPSVREPPAKRKRSESGSDAIQVGTSSATQYRHCSSTVRADTSSYIANINKNRPKPTRYLTTRVDTMERLGSRRRQQQRPLQLTRPMDVAVEGVSAEAASARTGYWLGERMGSGGSEGMATERCGVHLKGIDYRVSLVI